MKDAQCAESNEKSIFRFFPIFNFRVFVKIHRKLGWFEYKNDHNSKNKNRKKFESWFFIRFSTLRIFHENRSKTEWVGEGGSAYLYLGQGKRFKNFSSAMDILSMRSLVMNWRDIKTIFEVSRNPRFDTSYICILFIFNIGSYRQFLYGWGIKQISG